jgi:hypothetical protein
MSPIKHLSASSLCLFKSQPSLWIGKYLMGWKDQAGAAAWRGSAVEAGLDAALFGLSDPLAKARERFELDAQGEAGDDVQKQRDLLAPLLGQASMACLEIGQPTGRQFKVELRFDGIEWPVIGYIDYLYHDFLFDLKTTERLPSAPRADHILQQAIYAEASGRPAKLLYVTPKKSAWYEVTPEMQAEGLAEARRLAGNIGALLRLSDDPKALLRAFPIDPENFRWSDETKKLALTEQAA